MCENIAVSVICNTYNHEKYISDAIEGFLKQKTSFRFEVLIHDDASTDQTAEIIRKYEKQRPDIIKAIYEIENQYHKHDGTIKKLQMQRAKGKYIAFCEGDDYWTDPYKLQKQYDFMEQHPEYTLCGCSTDWLNMLNNKVEKRCKTDIDIDLTLDDFVLPKNGRPFPTVSFFMKPEIWIDLPNWGFPVGDLPLTYYAAIRGKVRMLSDTMCVYRWYSEGSWTARKGNAQERSKVCEKMINGYQKMNADTEYIYDATIQKRIHWYKYTLALMNRDYKAIRSKELADLYNNRSFIHRLSDWMRCKTPKVYSIAQRLLGRNL